MHIQEIVISLLSSLIFASSAFFAYTFKMNFTLTSSFSIDLALNNITLGSNSNQKSKKSLDFLRNLY